MNFFSAPRFGRQGDEAGASLEEADGAQETPQWSSYTSTIDEASQTAMPFEEASAQQAKTVNDAGLKPRREGVEVDPHLRPIMLLKAKDGGRNYLAGRDINENHYHPGLVRARHLDVSAIERLADLFVWPSDDTTEDPLRDALRSLQKRAVAVVIGPKGIGKSTAAQQLLYRSFRSSHPSIPMEGRLRRIVPDWDQPDVAQLSPLPDHYYLLDLSDAANSEGTTERPGADFAEDLLDFSHELQKIGSALVIVATKESWRECRPVASEISFDIGMPSAVQVAEAHIKIFGSISKISWLSSTELAKRLTSKTRPVEAVRVAEAVNRNGSLQSAVEELDSWHDHILKWFEKHTDVSRRALLVAAATLGPARPSAIRQAALLLREQIGDPDLSDQCPLAGDGLLQQMRILEAYETSSGYDITASRPRYDEAVIDYVWDQHSGMQDQLVQWMFRLVQASVEGVTPSRVGVVGVGIALRHGNHGFLRYAEQLASRNDQRLLELALSLIDETVLDQRVGGKVRAQLLEWASSESGPNARLAARACGRKLGVERTQQSLTRLSRLLYRPSQSAHVDAVASLITLFLQEQLSVGIFETVLGWLDGSIPKGKIGSDTRRIYKLAGVSAMLAITSTDRDLSPGHLLMEMARAGDIPVESVTKLFAIGALSSHDAVGRMNSWLDMADSGKLDGELVELILGPALRGTLIGTVAHQVLGGGAKPGGMRARILRDLISVISAPGQSDTASAGQANVFPGAAGGVLGQQSLSALPRSGNVQR